MSISSRPARCLRAAQRRTLEPLGVGVTWHEVFEAVPAGPAIVLANEFFDALPVRHYIRTPQGWCERLVGLRDGHLVFGAAPDPEPTLTLEAPPGTIFELGLTARRIAGTIASRLVHEGGAALAIDYGYAASRLGETLQAVQAHRFVEPLAEPGNADLTTHVDFSALARSARQAGALVHGPVPQGAFLQMLGIEARAEILGKQASPAQTEAIEGRGRAPDRTGYARSARHGSPVPGSGFRVSVADRTAGVSIRRRGSAMTLQPILAPELAVAGVSHGFFTRQGGASRGVYASLNGGIGSRDDRDAVLENRRRMAESLGVAPDRFLVPYQVHSALAEAVSEPFDETSRPRCDALVTRVSGLALGVTGADCGVVLFADPEARVIGAAHAGWKGALGGVLEATVETMLGLGARKAAIRAVLGPTIGQPSYEVGPEFRDRFAEAEHDYAAFFVPSAKPGHFLFDLPGFIVARLRTCGIRHVADLGLDTYADEARFFSYRRTTHRGEPDYGRLIAAIALM